MLCSVIFVSLIASQAYAYIPLSFSGIRARSGRLQVASESTPPATPAAESAAPEWTGAKKFSMKDRYTNTVLSSDQISKILPHRYPFLLVDRVVEFIPGKSAVGIKCITANEPQFTGHFPDRPIMPGVLMIEAMAQLGGIICLSPPVSPADGNGQKIFFFTGVNGVRWKSPVTPGDDLIMEMTLVSFDERLGFATMTGKAYVGGRICVEVKEFTFALAR